MRNRWEQSIQRKNWRSKSWERVCSAHFEKSCFSNSRKRYLKDDAIPTLFDFAPHIQPKEKKFRSSKSYDERQELFRVRENSSDGNSTEYIPVPRENSNNSLEFLSPTTSTSDANKSKEKSTQTYLTLHDIEMYESLHNESCKVKRSLHAERMKTCRLRKKVKGLHKVIEDMKQNSMISEEFVTELLENTGKNFLSIVENELKNGARNPQAVRYSEEVKKFSLTVYFHSPAAYRYLCSQFTLPHEKTLLRWTSKADNSPGFTTASLEIIRAKINNKEIDPECVLVIDSMSIRKQIIFSQQEGRNVGYVDIGIGDETTTLAGEALVFLVNGLRRKWRYPVGYFFVGKLFISCFTSL